MRRPLLCTLCCLALLTTLAPPNFAQSEFRDALKTKYDFRTVSCLTCHASRSEIPEDQQEAYKKNAKSFLNAFGHEFDDYFKGKDVTKRLEEVHGLARDDPKKQQVVEELTELFLNALKEIEAKPTAEGATYGELLKNGTLDGVRPR